MKEKLSINGAAITHTSIPSSATITLQERIRHTLSSNLRRSVLSYASAMVFTPLVGTPMLVESPTSLRVELKRAIRPMPPGPRITATSLLRIIATRILSPWMVPNTLVYLRICL